MKAFLEQVNKEMLKKTNEILQKESPTSTDIEHSIHLLNEVKKNMNLIKNNF